MGYRDDPQFVGPNLIDDAVREPAKEIPAPVTQFAKGRRNDDQFHFNAARTRARASAMGIT